MYRWVCAHSAPLQALAWTAAEFILITYTHAYLPRCAMLSMFPNMGRLVDSVRHALPGCRSKEGRGDRRQTGRAASKLTLEEIRSGAAAQPPGSPGPNREPAAAPDRVLSGPVVQPDTPFANASLQVLLQTLSAPQLVYHTLRNVGMWLCLVYGPVSGLCRAWHMLTCGLLSQGSRVCGGCRTTRRRAGVLQRTGNEARWPGSCSQSRLRGNGAPGAG